MMIDGHDLSFGDVVVMFVGEAISVVSGIKVMWMREEVALR